MKINLGIVWKDGKVINHRSLLKVLFNPLLRCAGWQITSVFENDEFLHYCFSRCRPCLKSSWRYDISGCVLEKRRRFV
jgi:hypothetical protein